MTNTRKYRLRRGTLPAAVAALLLAGCSTGHIGESWQCPLAEGGLCDSVAAADPAVPDAKTQRGTALGEPLWRMRAAETDAIVQTPCAADCDGGFDPFAWLVRLFQAEPGSGAGASDDGGAFGPPDTGSPPETAGAAAQTPAASMSAGHRPLEPATAALPAEPEAAEDGRADDGPHEDDLRTGEVVARIWIAPFVDADGVYREASHVRVVLEPAGWRLK